VDSDDLVKATKGPGRPIHDEMHRFSLVNSLSVVSVAFIFRRLDDLDKVAADFDVDELYKCEVWKDRAARGERVYGANPEFVRIVHSGGRPASQPSVQHMRPRLVIVPDVPGMVSTTRIIERIRSGNLPVPTMEPVDNSSTGKCEAAGR
jgi:hypothetical protein